jgi:mannosyltransferase
MVKDIFAVSAGFIKKHKYLILALIFFLGLFLRIYNLNEESFWLDEVITARFIQQDSLPNVIEAVTEINTYSPAIFIIMFYWTKLFGLSEFTLRLVPALIGAFTIPLMYIVTKKISKDVFISLFASFILAINRVHIYHSQDSKEYTFMIFLVLASTYFFFRLLENNQRIPYYDYCIITALNALGLYTKYLFAFVIMAQGIVFIARFRKSLRNISVYIMFSLIMVVIFLPWVGVILNQDFESELNPEEKITWGLQPDLISYMHGILMSYLSFPPDFPILFLALFMFGIYYGVRHLDKYHAAYVPLMIFSSMFIVLTGSVITGIPFMSRHFSFALPLYLLYVIIGIMKLKDKKIVILLCVFVIGLMVAANISYYEKPLSPDLRATAQKLKEIAQPGELVLVFPGFQEQILDFYLETKPAKIMNTKGLFVSEKGEAMRQNILQRLDYITSFNRTFIVVADTKGTTPYEYLLDELFNETGRYNLTKVRIVEYKIDQLDGGERV